MYKLCSSHHPALDLRVQDKLLKARIAWMQKPSHDSSCLDFDRWLLSHPWPAQDAMSILLPSLPQWKYFQIP